MINVSEAYKQSCESNEKQSYIIAKYGAFDKTLKSKIQNIEGNKQNFSSMNKLYNEIKETNFNYISCEPNRVKLNETFYFINDKTKPNENENLALWTGELSNANGTFATNPKIRIYFTEKTSIVELTLYFQEVCSDFKIYYYDNTTVVATREITNNNSYIVTTTSASTISEATINMLEIEFTKTKEPYRFVKLNEIDFGVYQTFTNKEIKDLNIIDELSIDSSELSSNYLSLTVDDTSGKYNILNPNNKLSMLQEKQELTIYHFLKVGNSFKEVPLGTFLLKEFKTNKNTLTIEAYDDTYFMNEIYYGSHYYNNEGITKILEDLFNYFNYANYEIDEELKDVKLSGYIPNVEFREALRLIAEAGCCVISKTRYGKTYIYKTYDPTVKTFTRRLIFKEQPVRNLFNNVIDLVEYNYTKIESNIEVYNAHLEEGTYTILYTDFPIVENTLAKASTNAFYQITNIYATSCEITVLQATDVVLRADVYRPTSIVARKRKETLLKDEYAISKIDNKLITSSNSNDVATWKLGRKDIKYNFNTLVLPYIEVGDTCNYDTGFNAVNTFIPTRIEFDKSMLQTIEGE